MAWKLSLVAVAHIGLISLLSDALILVIQVQSLAGENRAVLLGGITTSSSVCWWTLIPRP